MRVIFVFLFFFLSNSLVAEQLKVKIASEAAILINGDTGKVLYEKNAYFVCPPASLTKIATAIYAIKCASHRLDERFVATAQAVGAVQPHLKAKNNYKNYPSYYLETDATHIGIKKDEVLTLRELLHALMIASAG